MDLVNQTGECAHIAILSDQRALYFDKYDTNLSLKVDHQIGTLAPLHLTALGKILMAYNNINLIDYFSHFKNIKKNIKKISIEIQKLKLMVSVLMMRNMKMEFVVLHSSNLSSLSG